MPASTRPIQIDRWAQLGDWKWLKETFSLRHYANNDICHLCTASRSDEAMFYTQTGPSTWLAPAHDPARAASPTDFLGSGMLLAQPGEEIAPPRPTSRPPSTAGPLEPNRRLQDRMRHGEVVCAPTKATWQSLRSLSWLPCQGFI